MLSKVSSALLFPLLSLSGASVLEQKRASTSGVTLYVYGYQGPGAPVFYVDGLAYFGGGASSLNGSVVTDITFTVDKTSTTVPWTIAANGSSISFNETESLYIVPSNDTISQVGFSGARATLPDGAVTTGFAFFGTSAAYAASDSNYELMFWAIETSVNGTYGLYWKESGAIATDGFPVVVKTTAPTFPSHA